MDKKELLSECYQELFFIENHLNALSVAMKNGIEVEDELNRLLDKYNAIKQAIKELKKNNPGRL